MAFPKTLGGCVDKLYQIEQARDKLAAQDKKLQTEYQKLHAHVMSELPKARLDGATGKAAKAVIRYSDVPTGIDWKTLRSYIVKTKSWDLLQKRLSNPAFRERWAQKVVVPGVQILRVAKLSVTKR